MKPQMPKHLVVLTLLAFCAGPVLAATAACNDAMQKYQDLRSRSTMDEVTALNTIEAEAVRQNCAGGGSSVPLKATPAQLPATPPQASGGSTTPPSPLATTPASPLSTPASPLSTPDSPLSTPASPLTTPTATGTTPASPLDSLQPPGNTALQPPANTTLQPAANTTLQPAANTTLQPAANTTLQPAAGSTVSGIGTPAAPSSTGVGGSATIGGSAAGARRPSAAATR